MTKAKASKAATAKAPAPETPPMPRLVETDPGVRDVSAPGSAEPAPGEDNNKRLAFLEDRATKLYAATFGLAGRIAPSMELAPVDEHEDAVDACLRIINQISELEQIPSEALAACRAADVSLQAFLADEFPDFSPLEGEAPPNGVIRLLTDLKGVVGTWRKQTEEANAELVAVNAKLADVNAELAALTAEQGESAEDARKLHKAAVRNLTDLFKDLPDTAAITLRFAEGNEFIRQVQPIDIKREELIPAGAKVILDKRIDFDPGVAPAFVNGAFLIAGRKSMRCEISNLRIGGGSMAALPAGFLEFGSAAPEPVST